MGIEGTLRVPDAGFRGCNGRVYRPKVSGSRTNILIC